MSFWNIFGNMAVSDKGETITRLSKDMSVSSEGVTYTKMGNMTYGSDGSSFNQVGSFSSDGSTRLGSMATGKGHCSIAHKMIRASYPPAPDQTSALELITIANGKSF